VAVPVFRREALFYKKTDTNGRLDLLAGRQRRGVR
jgi:hypothetical protein